MKLYELAMKMAGNWKHFDSFIWSDQPENPEQWCIIHTASRDAGLLDQSNHSAIEKRLAKYNESQVIVQHFTHWACGWINGFAIRVFGKRGKITAAFQEYYEIHEALESYPVLDDEDYSKREYEATLENIGDALYQIPEIDKDKLPKDWQSKVFSWLWDNNQRAIESRDDTGGYPDGKSLRQALTDLGYLQKKARNRMKHYIGMAGLHGCLPQTCSSYETYGQAVDSLAETHDLGRERKAQLKRDGYLELNIHRDGNEYIEITECNCENPEIHNDA